MPQVNSGIGVPNPENETYSNRRGTNVRLSEEIRTQAKAKARAQGQELWEYVTKLIEKDLGIGK